MAGYIDNSTDHALYDSYASGRASAGATLQGGAHYAEWSAVNDPNTCDFCGWCDGRIFDTRTQPNVPPMHHGCRCLIAYILSDEYPPTPDWGNGPPRSSYPPGSKGGCSPIKGKFSLADAVMLAQGGLPELPWEIEKVLMKQNPGTIALNKAKIKARQEIAEKGLEKVAWLYGVELAVGTPVSPTCKPTLRKEGQHPKFPTDPLHGYKSDWKKPFAASENPDMPYDMMKWRDQWAEDFLKKKGKKFVRNANDKLEELTAAWSEESTQTLREIFEALGRHDMEWLRSHWRLVQNTAPSFAESTASTNYTVYDLINAWDARQAAARAVARDIYGDTIKIYRGVKVQNRWGEEVYAALTAGDTEFSIGTEPISSWTTSLKTAQSFAGTNRAGGGFVLEKEISVDDLLFSWADDFNLRTMAEEEIVWLSDETAVVPKAIYPPSNGVFQVEVW